MNLYRVLVISITVVCGGEGGDENKKGCLFLKTICIERDKERE